MYYELAKVRTALIHYNIPYEDKSDLFMDRLHFINKYGVPCSVIFGPGSYGYDEGRLEAMPLVTLSEDETFDDVEGHLLAETIIEAWIKPE